MMMRQHEIFYWLARHCFLDLRNRLDGVVAVENVFRRFDHEDVIVERDEHRVVCAAGQSVQYINIFSDFDHGWWWRSCRRGFEFLEVLRTGKYTLGGLRVDL